jgi:hypothetical protein
MTLLSSFSNNTFRLPLLAQRLLFIAALLGASFAGGTQYLAAFDAAGVERGTQRLFPYLYFNEHLQAVRRTSENRPSGAQTEAEAGAASANESILLNNYIFLYYGHPLSRNMGILARHTKEELRQRLLAHAAEYRALAGGKDIRIGFYIIFGTVWPEGEIGIIRESVLREWIEFALENDMLVIIDHQIGRYTPEQGLRRLLPWLRYPNVHLAFDPEWRTTRPMREIGSVSAAEVNQLQQIMEDYMIENNIPGERLLITHQFNWVMITNPQNVDTRRFTRVQLVHTMDGIGTPSEKRATYDFNARFMNMPVKGFKGFYDLGIPGAGVDRPLMTPREIMGLNPRPYVIMFQ